ncbi:hypothetical protein LFL96_36810 (plasmid) [Paraburkholderia sp. D15]|uniref:hypothetical protein n=1 Tax=Paraburkholderia sp. D15 TaxID=2880218 RepID=UPI002479DC8D|nr:hypothetical protein [Paraburkholderia sp. D15]WGS55040.1 hypothetical protein LFL96_36810 [Paraburkholderia sp. D15]
MKAVVLSAALLLIAPALSLATSPGQCVSWPRNIAEVKLKNAGITDPQKLDESKTRATRIASQAIGKDLYRDVYSITFYEKSGREIQVITASEASSSECSMGSVDVYVVSQKLADE